MESRHRRPQALTPSTTRFRLRLTAAALLLVGLCFAQSPGLLVADTKFDLALAPGHFLARALHPWDPEGAFGQLQNQAYGYLWPMGPLFGAGAALDVPGWVVQRTWVALVMIVALVGATRLARSLGVRSDLACLLAGFAYALSPRMLTTLGPISIEAWPSALAPWVLLPLVLGSVRGSPRRAAAWSALAVAMVGGVNAAATAAVLPLGVLWLLTRRPGPRRRTMLVWWPVLTMVGTLWWLVPLLTLGAYSPPFLDFIESAANTTFPTTLVNALRGTSDWVPYIDVQSRAGGDLIRQGVLALNSGVVLLLGLAGILQRRHDHRLFLSLGVLTGLLMVTAGHLGAVHGWAAADLRGLLDGVLAPLRNVHKFDPVLRLPLVLGLALVVDGLLERLGAARTPGGVPVRDSSGVPVPVAVAVQGRVNGGILVGAAVLAVAGAALPALAGRLTPADGLTAVPGYWSQTAAWLGTQPGTALLVPGSSFGDYVWGSPHDEPLQSLARSPWAVRNSVPLAPAGNIRMLDAVERRLAQGRASPGLAAYLRRAGVSHLVLRNDLTPGSDVPDPVLVHQAVDGSPGLRRVETFGPVLGGEAHLRGRGGSRILVNGGWQARHPAVEVYAVEGTAHVAETSDDPPVVVGGPEDLLDLADHGLVGDRPTVLAPDSGTPEPSSVLLTDGLRRTERNFGRVHDGSSATLGPGDPRRLGNPTLDYLPPGADRWLTTARVQGARRVSASSSMADADALGTVQPGQLPTAAVDGHPETAWVSNVDTAHPAWWQVDLEVPRRVGTVTVTAGPDDREVVRVRTRGWVSRPVELAAGVTRTVPVSGPATDRVRVEDASDRVGHRLALAEVGVPALRVRRSLVLPRLPASWPSPSTIVLEALDDARSGCAQVSGSVRCVPGRQVAGEEPLGFRRQVELPGPVSRRAHLTVRPRGGESLLQLLLRDQPVGVSSSTQAVEDPRGSALAAIDGDPGTTWSAALSDVRPTLRLSWLGARRVNGLALSVDPDADARLPRQVTLDWPGGRRTVRVGADGRVRFPAVRTDQLTLRVDEAEPAVSLDFSSTPSQVPVGISELRVLGLPLLPVTLSRQVRGLPCGSGPVVSVDGRAVPTAVTASAADLYVGREAGARLCGSPTLTLAAGTSQVDVEASAAFTPTSLVLGEGVAGTDPPVVVRGADLADPVDRSLPVGPGRLLTVTQNVNPGWQAEQGARRLRPVVVDGWQQGWRLTGETTPVRLTYTPDRTYRVGLLVGLVLLVGLAVGCCLPRRRRSTPVQPGPVGARAASPLVLAALGLGGAGLLAGWSGVLVAVLVLAVGTALERRFLDPLPWALAAIVLPAALAYAVRPWGGIGGWAGLLAWPDYLVVAVLAALFLPPPGRAPRRWASRMPGSSTSR